MQWTFESLKKNLNTTETCCEKKIHEFFCPRCMQKKIIIFNVDYIQKYVLYSVSEFHVNPSNDF